MTARHWPVALLIAALLSACVEDPNIPGHGPDGPVQPIEERPRLAYCDNLQPSLGETRQTAGTTQVELTVTNDADETCLTRGYPTLSLVGGNGHTVGESAVFERRLRPVDVELTPGGSATALITLPDTNTSAAGTCRGGVERLRILLPRAGGEVWVPFSHEYCPGWSVTRFD